MKESNKKNKGKKIRMIILITIILLASIALLAKILLSDILVTERMYISITGRDRLEFSEFSQLDDYWNEEMTKILFIGNSYTYFNDMPNIVKEFAESTGKEVIIGSFTKGGSRLIDHLDPSRGRSEELKELLTYDWDVVILQDQSTTPVTDKGIFFEGIDAITPMIDREKTRIILYSTWARKDDERAIDVTELNKEEMRIALKNNYIEAAERIDAEIAPVGDAFHNAELSEKSRKLHYLDGSHPWYKGSYLAACVIYSTIFDESCEEFKYYGNILFYNRDFLQEIAQLTIEENK